MTIKKASAVWKGGIKDGGGTISTETGVLKDAPYGFKSRFENGRAPIRKNLSARPTQAAFQWLCPCCWAMKV